MFRGLTFLGHSVAVLWPKYDEQCYQNSICRKFDIAVF